MPTFELGSRWADVLGCRLHYVDKGVGPPLLMLHGNPTWSFLYRHLIGDLQRDYRCVAPDYPGFGLSQAAVGYDFDPRSHARVIEEFLLTSDLRDVTLVAQDWGGPIGLWIAGRNPERFSGLVLGNTWGWPVNGDLIFELFSRFWGGALGRALVLNFNAFVNVLLPLGTVQRLPRAVMEAYRAPFQRRAARLPTHLFPRAILGSRDFLVEVEAGLGRLKHLPVLLAWGARDPAFRAKERRRFEQVFPLSRTVVLPDASHYIQEDSPEKMAAAIRAWHSRTCP